MKRLKVHENECPVGSFYLAGDYCGCYLEIKKDEWEFYFGYEEEFCNIHNVLVEDSDDHYDCEEVGETTWIFTATLNGEKKYFLTPKDLGYERYVDYITFPEILMAGIEITLKRHYI